MPTEHDLDPPAMTEKERLAKRRYQAYFVFEMMIPGGSTVLETRFDSVAGVVPIGDGHQGVRVPLPPQAHRLSLLQGLKAAPVGPPEQVGEENHGH